MDSLESYINKLKYEDQIHLSNDEIAEMQIKSDMIYGEEYIRTIHNINELMNGECVFCGSFALNFFGLLNRKVKDIDVLSYNDPRSYKTPAAGEPPIEYNSFMVGEDLVACMRTSVGNIGVDILYYNQCKSKIKYIIADFYGKLIKIEQPGMSLAVKNKYLTCTINEDSINKHKSDIKFVEDLANGNANITI